MTMVGGKCACAGGKPGEGCPACAERELPAYWCDSCRQAVAGKRCPLCGLKARKRREQREGRAT